MPYDSDENMVNTMITIMHSPNDPSNSRITLEESSLALIGQGKPDK